ncbi:MAG: pyrroline-5-carboxylate reductase [Candidatus Omnitrophica bacterium]|nr:pyrroline-5-carboxylate reductase [Candidatus Omnitrophota bacterium]MDD5518299.1 pyrroline-5-carboxylate reductase [Candidatus Omnitrophota bacterium]
MKINLLKKIGIIGFGNMGSVIAQRLSAQKDEYEVFVFDKEKSKLANLAGIKAAKDARDLAAQVEIIILAIKPQDFNHILKDIKGSTGNRLIISIAAGISTGRIEKLLGQARVIRVMPNIGAKVAESVTCLCKGALATDDDLELAQELFYYLGAVRIIDEPMMNAATAISGSGPAYVFYFIENSTLDPENIPEHARHDMMRRLEKAAQGLGFSTEDAAFLAANTTNAAISLLHKTKLPAQELRKQVTSKGGTTEAALEILTRGGSWEEAAQAALKRAQDLARRL